MVRVEGPRKRISSFRAFQLSGFDLPGPHKTPCFRACQPLGLKNTVLSCVTTTRPQGDHVILTGSHFGLQTPCRLQKQFDFVHGSHFGFKRPGFCEWQPFRHQRVLARGSHFGIKIRAIFMRGCRFSSIQHRSMTALSKMRSSHSIKIRPSAKTRFSIARGLHAAFFPNVSSSIAWSTSTRITSAPIFPRHKS